jgi:Flp pilus assembly pilin Flp
MVRCTHKTLVDSANRKRNKAGVGTTMTEYALAGVLVAGVSIAGLQLLGHSVNSSLATMLHKDPGAKPQQPAAAPTLPTNPSATTPPSTVQPPTFVSSFTQSQLEQLQMSSSERILTVGVNGSSELLASQLSQTAELLLAENKVTEEQYNILAKLAKQGQQIAQIQSMVSSALHASNGNYDQFANTNVTLDGKTYTALQLTSLIGFSGPTPEYFGTNDILAAGSTAEPEIASFLNLYQQALASGALSDPVAKATIDSASSQIAGLGEVTENVMQGLEKKEYTTADDVMNSKEAGMVQALNLATACQAADFQANGVLCTP